MLKLYFFCLLKLRERQQRQLLAMKIMFSERSLVPYLAFKNLVGLWGRLFEKKWF